MYYYTQIVGDVSCSLVNLVDVVIAEMVLPLAIKSSDDFGSVLFCRFGYVLLLTV